jgi:methylated-DNA-protein-cysteine methyltransferase-like protein
VTELEEAIARVLLSLEAGDVVTYGQIAEEAGYPGRARAVGRVLSQSDGEYAWWRVVNAAGRLVPGHERTQARRLRAEGVEVRGNRVKAPDRR